MEEFVGDLWHRFITRAARRDYPAAAVQLADIEKTAGILFRAFGGDPGLRVAASADTRHGGRRRWLERIAHSGERGAAAARDAESLKLPPTIALFPQRELNRDLYLWLIALGAQAPAEETDWIVAGQQATLAVLARYPGLEPRYRRLVEAIVAQRIDPERMPPDEAAQERAVREALRRPGSVASLPPLTRRKANAVQPVPLWLVPATPSDAVKLKSQRHDADGEGGAVEQSVERKRYAAERTEMPDNESPMVLMFRAESLLSFAEYVKVNRATDDEPDPHVGRVAEDLDRLSVARDDAPVASKVRFDLDLPSAAEDDEAVGEGIALPEWDWKRRVLKPDWCRLQTLRARAAQATPIPPRLARPARRLRSQFAALQPARRWARNQRDGEELDIEACVRGLADRMAGSASDAAGAYLARSRRERDLACLLLADLSLSTDAWVSDEHRVIDVVRDSMMLFSEALSASGDAFALYGFSSLKRGNVRFHEIKPFATRFDATVRGRIAAVKPGFYTRMGAAVRRATTLLAEQAQSQRLLLILSDGKPTDIDAYEGRQAIEDTRMSLMEARRAGVRPFCVTIDRDGADYLGHLFGPAGFTVLRRPEELPARLPQLYAQLTGRGVA